jgi:hypothetical protein
MRLGSVALLVASLLLSAPCQAGEFAARRGVNFEAWQTWTGRSAFMSKGYDRSGFPDWRNRVDNGQLAALRAQGFDFVRLNVDASPFFWVGDAGVAPLLDSVVAATRRLQGAGLAVVVDMHVLPEMDDRPDGLHDVLGTDRRTDALFDTYVGLVGRMAARLASLPRGRTALELVNEPDQDWFSHLAVTDRWPGQLLALYRAARKAAPELTLVLSGARSSSIDGLLRLAPAPFSGDERILWTFHYYEPMAVTHAGQPWEETPARFLTHLPYPADRLDQGAAERLLAEARRSIDAAIADPARRRDLCNAVARALDDYRASRAAPSTVAADFARVSAWAKANGIPAARILVGEFGVFQDAADPSARIAVLAAIRQAAEAAGFSWAVYTAGLTSAHRSFGVMSDTARLSVEPEVRKALGLDDD